MANHTVSWKPDPDYRGTFDIFSSCLGTLLICIWSAIHVDVVKGKSWYERVGEKMGWVLVGLLIPELTLFIAFTQLQRARKLKKEVYALLWKDLPPAESWYYTLVRKIYGPQSHEKFTKASRNHPDELEQQAQPNTTKARKHPWTLAHSFFVVMGGFRLHEFDETGESYLPKWQSEAIITPQGWLFLMEKAKDLIPDISAEEIQDKSKADGLAKGVLVLQVLWFCINSGTRIAQNLPLSLLEIMTISHGFCALITYALWWSKPKDVKEPIVIGAQSKDIALYGAWMSIASGGERYFLGGFKNLRHWGEHAQLLYVSARELSKNRTERTHSANPREFTLPHNAYGFLPYPEEHATREHATREHATRELVITDMIRYRFRVAVKEGEEVIEATLSLHENGADLPNELQSESFAIPGTSFMHLDAGETNPGLVFLPMHRICDHRTTPCCYNAAIWRPWRSVMRGLFTIQRDYTFRFKRAWWHFSPDQRRQPSDNDPTCQRRWSHAARLISQGKLGSGSGSSKPTSELFKDEIKIPKWPYILPVASLQASLPAVDENGNAYTNVAWFIANMLLPAAYGAPYLLGWSTTFPTDHERILWRVAALVATFCNCILYLVVVSFRWECRNDDKIQAKVAWLGRFGIVLASGFLVVESFRQLFALPSAAFELPVKAWTDTLPHFS